MKQKITILGISGSLREGSYNTAVLRSAIALAPANAEVKVFEGMSDLPLFNQDLEKNPPHIVTDLKEKVRAADCILFATPEYNYSIPGVLKNAIDWASRPYGDSAWEGKPVGIMSAAAGMLGGARAQYHLRQIFVFLNMHPLNKPEVIIPQVQSKIDAQGTITDTHTKEKVAELLDALVKWTIELRTGEKLLKEKIEQQQYEGAYGRMVS